MGLSESKAPLSDDGRPSTPKEIGISSMWDPRSPSSDFQRTPIFDREQNVKLRDNGIGIIVDGDPRSPSNEIPRTPVSKGQNEPTANDTENELRLHLDRLQIYNGINPGTTDSTENLANDSETVNAVSQQKTILKLLDQDSSSSNNNSMWLPETPPCPQSRSTPKTMMSPDTPESGEKDTDCLIKKRRASAARGKNKEPQGAEKLQKKVLKKSLAEQSNRSPLSQRNGVVIAAGKPSISKTKPGAFVKSRKFNSQDESFGANISGKENEHIVW